MNPRIIRNTLLTTFGLAWLIALVPGVSAQEAAADNQFSLDSAISNAQGLVAIGAGLAVGLAGIGSGLGESNIGAAAVGAMAEDEKLFGKGLIMTVLPETIVIFGLVVSLLLIFAFPIGPA